MASKTYVEPFDIKDINRKLKRKFGEIEGKQKFRIVWSDAQTEFRKLFHVSGIQLLYPEIRETAKYPYAPSQWVMERWVAHGGNAEIATMEGGTYEPVWTFRAANGESLRPVWRAADIIALSAEGGLGRESMSDYLSKDQKQLESEIEMFEDMLGEQGPDYGNQTDAFVAPVFYDATKQKYRK